MMIGSICCSTLLIVFILLFAVLTCLMIFACGAITVFAADGGKEYVPKVYSSFWALVPPIVAIGLALITKEVYSSLFVGIAIGGIFWSNFHFEKAVLHIFEDGIVGVLTDSYNMGILVFLVILGIMVCMMNNAGGSAAFGRWASIHIKTRVGAQLATIVLGILIFIDDYFNCLTVGSVMRPVTDKHNISRAKLAYLIDATAAPICIIAPVSSWAAAVTSSVPKGSDINGFNMFLQTIPYNFYAITTLSMMILLTIMKFDFGSMKVHEDNANKGDLFTTAARPYGDDDDNTDKPNGAVIDLVLPVIVLIICCIIGMIYSGGFFTGESFVDAFAGADAPKGLVLGSMATFFFTFCFYMVRNVMTFKEFTECIPAGFRAMVAPIMILTMAWTLSGMTGLLGAKFYVHDLVANSAGILKMFLPTIIFVVAMFLAFSTGTSWGTFSILIPVVCNVFGSGDTYEMLIISIAACLSGAVCGDHCSPISDTTIMASAGAHSDHVNHVSTQLPYALTAASVSVAGYLIAGGIAYFTESSLALIALPITLCLLFVTLLVMRTYMRKQTA